MSLSAKCESLQVGARIPGWRCLQAVHRIGLLLSLSSMEVAGEAACGQAHISSLSSAGQRRLRGSLCMPGQFALHIISIMRKSLNCTSLELILSSSLQLINSPSISRLLIFVITKDCLVARLKAFKSLLSFEFVRRCMLELENEPFERKISHSKIDFHKINACQQIIYNYNICFRPFDEISNSHTEKIVVFCIPPIIRISAFR